MKIHKHGLKWFSLDSDVMLLLLMYVLCRLLIAPFCCIMYVLWFQKPFFLSFHPSSYSTTYINNLASVSTLWSGSTCRRTPPMLASLFNSNDVLMVFEEQEAALCARVSSMLPRAFNELHQPLPCQPSILSKIPQWCGTVILSLFSRVYSWPKDGSTPWQRS